MNAIDKLRAANIKIATLNVRGLRGKRRYSVYRWIRKNNFHICLLQETYFTKDISDMIRKGWDGNMINNYSNSVHSRGVSILFSKNIPCKILSTHSDNNGRLLLVNFEYENVLYSICNVYCPNDVSDRVAFLTDLNTFLQKNAMSKLRLIGGDFNCVTSESDKISGILDKSSHTLKLLQTSEQLTDAWRKLNENLNEYSYIDPSSRGNHSRIDKWLVTDNLVQNITSCYMTQAPAPDHKAVVLMCKLYQKKRGPGYWKLNNSILDEPEYRQSIEQLYNDITRQYSGEVPNYLLWEFLKIKIKEYSISYCTIKSARHKSKINEIEEKLNNLDKNNKHCESQRKALKRS